MRAAGTFGIVVAVLLAIASNAALAAFPGANGKIAFGGTVGYSGSHIFVIEPDRSGLEDLSPDGAFDFDPAWSADGERIAFSRYHSTAPELAPHCELFVMNADGGDVVQVTDAPDPDTFSCDQAPTWSPDGRRIAFSSDRDHCPNCGQEIYVVQLDSGNVARLTNITDAAPHPAWSPDANRIAFSHYDPATGKRELYLMNADGTGVRQLTDDSGYYWGYPSGVSNTQPDWSPDGTQIAFTSGGGGDVHIMNVDGTARRSLFAIPMDAEFDPTWSPDGTTIVYNGGSGLGTALTDGTHIRALTLLVGDERSPSWQPLDRPPDCSGVGAAPDSLWPPNHQLRPVTLAGATDPDGDAVAISIDGVTQDEPVGSAPDAATAGAGRVLVRAERDPTGDGRVYRIAFTASDGRGGTCSGTASVGAPRRSAVPAVDSAPPSYDSLAP